ncbi:MAG: acyl-ACP--UDP-N-acetylglucosamine O-acyltransferase [Gemmataceae bacterium]|nr:acyl-ACP--UDP-N-acetylglucosamine O-acyltransferase [Gemmataceae bacterium]
MSRPFSARIHHTAVVAPEAVLGEHVDIGAYAIIEGPVTIGDGCVIRPQACLYGPLTMGRNNTVFSGAVLGERPQHLKYNGEPTTLDIGDDNVFREHVTIHRGTTHSMKTTIGSRNFFMVNSHVAHDCVIGNHCILTNGSMLGGHCVMEDQAILSGNSVVHQYTRIGRLSLLSGVSGTSKDIPPFMIQQGYNSIYGVNVVGMRRAGMTHEQIDAVRTAFKVLFRDGMPLSAAIAKLEHDLGSLDVIHELVGFLRGCTRGINSMRSRTGQEAA